MKTTGLFLLFFAWSFFCIAQNQNQRPTKCFDKKGNLVERSRINYFGDLEADFNGIASMKYEYDRKGNLTKKSYFDKVGKPFIPDTTSRKGSPEFPSYTLYTYEDGKLIKISHHNATGGLLDLQTKSAIQRFKYDSYGRMIEEANFDKYGRYVGVGRLEVAYTKYAYNFKNQLIEEKSYSKDKKILDFGMNIAAHFYDSLNRRVRTSYFFANSDLYHTDKFFYDGKNNLIKEESYNKYNKLEYTITYSYDFYGQVIKKIFDYPDGTKVVKKNGIELDVKGWKMTFAPTIKDIGDVDGYGSFLIKLDNNGRIVEIRNSSCSAPLAYALYPFLRDCKIQRDQKVGDPLFKGEIKVGVLNKDPLVEEY